MLLGPAPQASAADAPAITAPENAAASIAVTDLTSGGPGSVRAMPADFGATSGYQPVLADGMVLNPGGDCSSPVTLPTEFDAACKAHDLGYDLLRYAQKRGEPLGPWARQAIDATLDRHMHQACETRADSFSRTRCEAMADIANTAVDLNSRRQDYGAPVREEFLDNADAAATNEWWQFAMVVPGVLGLGAVFTVRTRRRLAATAAARRVDPVDTLAIP
ncbi:hypothetical protein GCM10023318_46400 [Nocardia callitridis]|uniref:Phospholipase n=2 Tax=Nocardia callitridis TaxID=648753 RepID=A0ABP9KNG7_9NOCA